MLFSNKWANLLFMVVMISVITVAIVKHTKVLDTTGKDTGDRLGFKATA